MFRDEKTSKFDPKLLSFSLAVADDNAGSSKADACSMDLATLQLDECSGACVRIAVSGGGALDGALLSLKILPRCVRCVWVCA